MKLVYNSIPDQHMYSPNQLTMQIWNNIVNQLRKQTNLNTEYLQQLHKHLFGDYEYKFDTDTSVFSRVSYKDDDETITGQKEYTKRITFKNGFNVEGTDTIFNTSTTFNSGVTVNGKTYLENVSIKGESSFNNVVSFNDQVEMNNNLRVSGATSFVNNTYFNADGLHTFYGGAHFIGSTRFNWRNVFGPDELQESGSENIPATSFRNNIVTFEETTNVAVKGNISLDGESFVTKEPTDDKHIVNKVYVDNLTNALTNGNLIVNKANCDAYGNNIRSTYASKNELTSRINNVVEIAEGKTKAYSLSIMNTVFINFVNADTFDLHKEDIDGYPLFDVSDNIISFENLKVGDIFYFIETDVPDRWVAEIHNNVITFSKMETAKVNLTNYVTKNDLIYLESDTIYVNDYISTPIIYSQALYDGDDIPIADFVDGELILYNDGNPINVNKVLNPEEFYMKFTNDDSFIIKDKMTYVQGDVYIEQYGDVLWIVDDGTYKVTSEWKTTSTHATLEFKLPKELSQKLNTVNGVYATGTIAYEPALAYGPASSDASPTTFNCQSYVRRSALGDTEDTFEIRYSGLNYITSSSGTIGFHLKMPLLLPKKRRN